jgi:flagellar hook-associated protein 2
MSPGLQLGGLVSGMDTDSVIQQLLSIEAAPKQRMQFSEAVWKARQNGLNNALDKLKSLKLASDDLSSILTWSPTQTVDSSDPTKVTATLNGGAAPGGYLIQVTQMATSTQKTFEYATQSAQSTITVGGVSVSLDAGATIDDAVSAINSNASLGVYAVNIGNGKLVLSSRTTGAASGFTASGAGLTPDAATPDRVGQDAVMTVNGQTVTSGSNTVTADSITSGSPIPGVDFTIKSITDGTTINVSPPGTDRDQLKDRIKAFVSSYNDMVDSLRAMTSEQKVKDPTSAADAAKGALFGDSGLNDALSTLRLVIGSPVQNATTFTTLADIGISTGDTTGDGTINDDAVAGKLTFDESKLDAALDKDPQAVQRLLGGQLGTAGFAQGLSDALKPLTQAGGVFDQRISSTSDEISSIDDQMTQLDTRLSAKETLLRQQFSAMESAMATSQQQLQYLMSKLGS